MFSVLIVDPSTLLRCGLKHTLLTDLGPATVGEANNIEVARELFKKRQWEVVVVALSLTEPDLQVIREIKQDLPSARIMLLGLGRDHQTITRAVSAGASGYLRKDASLTEVIWAFRRLRAGENYFGERMGPSSAASLPHTKLSAREHLVLAGIAQGKRIGEIAGELALDVRTVSTYRRRALQKMSMHTNAELIRYVAHHGIETSSQQLQTVNS